jgi:hypothetical protein
MSKSGAKSLALHVETAGGGKEACLTASQVNARLRHGSWLPCKLAHPHKCPAGAHAAVACRPIPGAQPGRPLSQRVHWRSRRWRWRGGSCATTGRASAGKPDGAHILLAALRLGVDLQSAKQRGNERWVVGCWHVRGPMVRLAWQTAAAGAACEVPMPLG